MPSPSARPVVRIRNVKNVKALDFTLPPPGVHLLTGRNGSGKTTLLAALYRIGHGNAFAEYFRTTSHERLDSFTSASVSYKHQGSEVSYNYRGTRWAPTPKKNTGVLKKIGYPKVVFIAANAKRIEPTADDLQSLRVHPVDAKVADAAATILSDGRFSKLQYINSKRGKGNRAFLLPRDGDGRKQQYFSEKNFSLGELCVVKLVHTINSIPNNSLVLIDEVELALHPRAQVQLLKYVREVAGQKGLTVVFSTHSASLIKRAGRRSIMYLEIDKGVVTCVQECYPARVLGDIAVDDDITPDALVFVEDDFARFFFEAMLEKYKQKRLTTNDSPHVVALPIGGFKEVLHFLENSEQVFPASVQRRAVLDKDVETESLAEAKNNDKHGFLAWYDELKKNVLFLPCTPELGLFELFAKDTAAFAKKAKAYAGWNIDLESMLQDACISGPPPTRKEAKARVAKLRELVCAKTGLTDVEVCKKLASFYADDLWSRDEAKVLALVGSVLAPS